jgi:hypothetical protein
MNFCCTAPIPELILLAEPVWDYKSDSQLFPEDGWPHLVGAGIIFRRQLHKDTRRRLVRALGSLGAILHRG